MRPQDVRLLHEPDWRWRREGPTAAAVAAFGARAGDLRRLPGGAGNAWTDGRLVLKPTGSVAEHAWVCEVFSAWDRDDVRVPEPVRPSAVEGWSVEGWSVEGWGAHVFAAGHDLDLARDLVRRVPVLVEASEAFHRGVAHLPTPPWAAERGDPWAYGDRLAWEGGEPPAHAPTRALVEQLLEAARSVEAPDQPVHGDVLPNVLVAEGLPPAVIDWPPYFRPRGFALAVAATDAVTFRGAPASLLDDWGPGGAAGVPEGPTAAADWPQLLLRALVYRLGPTGVFAAEDRLMGSLRTHLERAAPVVQAVLDRVGDGRGGGPRLAR